MTFSATDAALEGFKITRARPTAALAWAGLLLVLPLIAEALVIGLFGSKLEAFTNVTLFAPVPPEDLPKLFPLMLGVMAVGIVIGIPVMGVLYAAIDRAVLRPDQGGFGWLAVGADELWQAVVLLCYGVVVSVAFVGGFIGFVLALSPLGALLGAPGAFIAGFFGVLAAVALTTWVGVRLSLAPPATFDRRAFVFFDTWALTRGHFWSLLGSYIIAWLFSLLVSIMVNGLGLMIASALPGTEHQIPTTFAALLSPKMIISILFGAFANGLALPLRVAPAAYAYREIAGQSRVQTFA
jgi:hypothetical protein